MCNFLLPLQCPIPKEIGKEFTCRLLVPQRSACKYSRYYHLARPRALGKLFTAGSSNGCDKDGISDIEYTFDIRSGTKYSNHQCSRFRDSSSAVNAVHSTIFSKIFFVRGVIN